MYLGAVGQSTRHLPLWAIQPTLAGCEDIRTVEYFLGISGASIKMTKLLLSLALTVLFIGMLPTFGIADDVPNLDFQKSCRTDARVYPGGGGDAACLADEQNARKTLVVQWAQFAAESRMKCVQTVKDISGSQSYVELLTCLQMTRDVKALPKNQ